MVAGGREVSGEIHDSVAVGRQLGRLRRQGFVLVYLDVYRHFNCILAVVDNPDLDGFVGREETLLHWQRDGLHGSVLVEHLRVMAEVCTDSGPSVPGFGNDLAGIGVIEDVFRTGDAVAHQPGTFEEDGNQVISRFKDHGRNRVSRVARVHASFKTPFVQGFGDILSFIVPCLDDKAYLAFVPDEPAYGNRCQGVGLLDGIDKACAGFGFSPDGEIRNGKVVVLHQGVRYRAGIGTGMQGVQGVLGRCDGHGIQADDIIGGDAGQGDFDILFQDAVHVYVHGGSPYDVFSPEDVHLEAFNGLGSGVGQDHLYRESAVHLVFRKFRCHFAIEGIEGGTAVRNHLELDVGDGQRAVGGGYRHDGDGVDAALFADEPVGVGDPCFVGEGAVVVSQGVPLFHRSPVETVLQHECSHRGSLSLYHDTCAVGVFKAVGDSFFQFYAARYQRRTLVVASRINVAVFRTGYEVPVFGIVSPLRQIFIRAEAGAERQGGRGEVLGRGRCGVVGGIRFGYFVALGYHVAFHSHIVYSAFGGEVGRGGECHRVASADGQSRVETEFFIHRFSLVDGVGKADSGDFVEAGIGKGNLDRGFRAQSAVGGGKEDVFHDQVGGLDLFAEAHEEVVQVQFSAVRIRISDESKVIIAVFFQFQLRGDNLPYFVCADSGQVDKRVHGGYIPVFPVQEGYVFDILSRTVLRLIAERDEIGAGIQRQGVLQYKVIIGCICGVVLVFYPCTEMRAKELGIGIVVRSFASHEIPG